MQIAAGAPTFVYCVLKFPSASKTWLRSSLAPGLDELAVLVELGHASVAVAIGDIDVPCGVPRHVSGPLKNVALSAGAGRSSTAPASRSSLSIGGRSSSTTTAPACCSTRGSLLGRLRCER